MLWYWLMIWILNTITYNLDEFLRFPSSEGIFPHNPLFDKSLNNNNVMILIDDMNIGYYYIQPR